MMYALRKESAALVGLALASAVIQVPFLDRGISFYDEGSILAIADGLHHGAVLYRDHVTPTAPLTYELMSVLFDLFGPSLLLGRVLQALAFTLCTLLVYGILREFTGIIGALIGALACLPVKALGFPLWTIVNYSQLAILFCFASVLVTLRFLRAGGAWWLLAAGAGVGLTLITKQNMGALLGVTLAGTVALDALREADDLVTGIRRTTARGLLMLAGALPLLGATIAYYAAAGVLGDFIGRAVLGLAYLTEPYALRPPLPYGSMTAGEVVFTYFPTPLAHLAWQGSVQLELGAPLYSAIARAVQGTFAVPLVAILLGAVAIVRGLFSDMPRSHWSRLMLIVLFGATCYASMMYRADWTHLMNVFPALLCVIFVVIESWAASSRWRRHVAVAAWGLWLAMGGLAAAVVFMTYSVSVDTPRGRLFSPRDEAENTRLLLAYLDLQSRRERIAFLRAEPLFYFLTDRRIPLRFDLVMPGLIGPGDDERIARSLGEVDQIIYNPKRFPTVPSPITEYAPETAHLVATRFVVARVLSPTAIVLTRADVDAPTDATVVDLWADSDGLSQFTLGAQPGAAELPRYERTSWMMYRVLATKIARRAQAACFAFHHTVREGDALVTTAMLDPIAWAQVRGYPDYIRDLSGAAFTITVNRPNMPETPVYAAERRVGRAADPVRIPLSAFTGSRVEIRFCAALPPVGRSDSAHTLAGWAEPRIVRASGNHLGAP